MRLARAAGLILALVALAGAGAAAALLLLSTIGGAPADDPVGRLRPVVPGLDVGATAPVATGPTATDDGGETTDDGGETTSEDDDRDRSDDD